VFCCWDMKWFCVAFVAQSAVCGIVFSRSVTHVIYTEDRTVHVFVCVWGGVFLCTSCLLYSHSSEGAELYTTLRNTEIRPEEGLCKRGVYS
jgi:hypothetical protein